MAIFQDNLGKPGENTSILDQHHVSILLHTWLSTLVGKPKW